MTTMTEDMALMELRVKLYGAAQLLKGEALEELKKLIAELYLVLDLDRPKPGTRGGIQGAVDQGG